MMQFLEFAALGVEHTIPRRFRAGDPATDVWLASTAHKAAAALRQEKRALFALKPGANGTLSQRLAQSLEQVTREDWASLRRVEVASMHIKRSRRLITLISTIVKAVLPLAAVLSVQETRFAISGQLVGVRDRCSRRVGGRHRFCTSTTRSSRRS